MLGAGELEGEVRTPAQARAYNDRHPYLALSDHLGDGPAELARAVAAARPGKPGNFGPPPAPCD